MPFFQLQRNYVPLICNQIMVSLLVDKNGKIESEKKYTHLSGHISNEIYIGASCDAKQSAGYGYENGCACLW